MDEKLWMKSYEKLWMMMKMGKVEMSRMKSYGWPEVVSVSAALPSEGSLCPNWPTQGKAPMRRLD